MNARRASCCAGLALAVLVPAAAHAGPPDLLVHSAQRPASSDHVVIAYEHGGGGFLYSRDRGETFGALCNAAISVSDADGGVDAHSSLQDVIVTGDGHVLVADLRGLWVDDGQFCNWARVPELAQERVMGLALDPRDPNVVYGALATNLSDRNGLFRRNADGRIERFGERSTNRINVVRVAERPDGGLRFYQTAIVGTRTITNEDAQVTLPDGGSAPSAYALDVYALRYSDDEGESWSEHVIETAAGQELWLEAVDPTDHERVVLQLLGIDGSDTLVVAERGGQTLTPWLELEEFTGLAIEPSGAAWIAGGGDGDGVWRAEQVGGEPRKVRPEPAYCIALHAEDLELCDREDYGVADRATAKLQAPTLYATLDRVHTCPGVDVVERCRMSFCLGRCAGNHWPESPMCADNYQSARGRGCSHGSTVIVPDAGAPDAGTAAPPSPGCSCRVVGARARHDVLIGWLGIALAARFAARALRRSGRPCSRRWS